MSGIVLRYAITRPKFFAPVFTFLFLSNPGAYWQSPINMLESPVPDKVQVFLCTYLRCAFLHTSSVLGTLAKPGQDQ